MDTNQYFAFASLGFTKSCPSLGCSVNWNKKTDLKRKKKKKLNGSLEGKIVEPRI
jgi:hypothetical protein